MKKLLSVALVAIALMACHSDIWDSIDELKKDYESLNGRVSKLEELCKEMNTNISALQTLVNAQQTGDYITAVTPITKDGKEIGYVITFAKNTPVTIYHGSNGTSGIGGQGSDGSTPVVGVAQDTDGIYYWTLNGTWMLNDKGERIRVTGLNGNDGSDGSSGKDGKDGITPQLKIEEGYWFISYDNGATWTNLGKATGENGANGTNGTNGTNGKDGVTPQLQIVDGYWYVSYDNGTTWTKLAKATGENGTNGTNGTNGSNGQDGKTPQLKIENGYWYVSYDNGTTWTQLGKATGEDGQNGTNGKDGDSMFKSVTQDDNYVYFTLSDNTVIKIAKGGNSGTGANVVIEDGAIKAKFAVSLTDTVYFSMGNLQYQASTGTWRFAEHQYDYIGDDNKKISSTFAGWIDLFGWGTSGWNSGAKAYQPYSYGGKYSDYYPGNSSTNGLTGDYANADWGVYNAISNGGNQPGMWRVLTKDEWNYIINNRVRSSSLYGNATVLGVPGLIILPDGWTGADDVLFTPKVINYTTNVYTGKAWQALESSGAIFLPAAGTRGGTSINGVGWSSLYWSSTPYDTDKAYSFQSGGGGEIEPQYFYYRSCGISVRLVKDVE